MQTIEIFRDPATAGGVLIEPMHGAPSRIASDATAFAGREARWNATFLNIWMDPDQDEPEVEKARAFSRSLEPWRIGGGYLNYATEAASESLETEFGAERFRRLVEVKREFDPENIFRFNHNIAAA
jgi:FAD/FMN-containing dehydrogenase